MGLNPINGIKNAGSGLKSIWQWSAEGVSASTAGKVGSIFNKIPGIKNMSVGWKGLVGSGKAISVGEAASLSLQTTSKRLPLIGGLIAAGAEALQEFPKVIDAFDSSKGGGFFEGIKQVGRSTLEVAGTGGGAFGGMLAGAAVGTAIGGLPGTIVGGVLGIVGGLIGEKVGHKVGKEVGEAAFGENPVERKQQLLKDMQEMGIQPAANTSTTAADPNANPYAQLYAQGGGMDPAMMAMLMQGGTYDPTNPFMMYALS